MNYQKLLAAIVAAALAVAPFLTGTAQIVVGTVAGIVGTFAVRPSQVTPKISAAVVEKIPGLGGTTDAQKLQAEDPPTGA